MVTTEQINENVLLITIEKTPTEIFKFLVDGNPPEPVYDRDNNLQGYTTLPEHALLIEDFKEIEKLNHFVNLVITNSNTAYSQYLIDRKNF